ncbi:hypothetical protein SPURM210S_01108 [Streptomyces purpurascens]
MPGSRPSSFSWDRALASFWPSRAGTRTVSGPSETVMLTESLPRMRVPGFGSELMIWPRSTVSL